MFFFAFFGEISLIRDCAAKQKHYWHTAAVKVLIARLSFFFTCPLNLFTDSTLEPHTFT